MKVKKVRFGIQKFVLSCVYVDHENNTTIGLKNQNLLVIGPTSLGFFDKMLLTRKYIFKNNM